MISASGPGSGSRAVVASGETAARPNASPSSDVAIRRGMRVLDASGQRAGSVEGWNFHPQSGRLASVMVAAHRVLHRHCALVEASCVEAIDEDGSASR